MRKRQGWARLAQDILATEANKKMVPGEKRCVKIYIRNKQAIKIYTENSLLYLTRRKDLKHGEVSIYAIICTGITPTYILELSCSVVGKSALVWRV